MSKRCCQLCFRWTQRSRGLTCRHRFCITCQQNIQEWGFRKSDSCEEDCLGCLYEDLNHKAAKSLVEDKDIQTAPLPKCDVCSQTGNDVVGAEAVFVCKNCNINMCEMCETNHNEVKAFECHEIIPVENKSKVETISKFCTEHKTQRVSYFCGTCQKEGCPICVLVKHKEHDVSLLFDHNHNLLKIMIPALQCRISHVQAWVGKAKEFATKSEMKFDESITALENTMGKIGEESVRKMLLATLENANREKLEMTQKLEEVATNLAAFVSFGNGLVEKAEKALSQKQAGNSDLCSRIAFSVGIMLTLDFQTQLGVLIGAHALPPDSQSTTFSQSMPIVPSFELCTEKNCFHYDTEVQDTCRNKLKPGNPTCGKRAIPSKPPRLLDTKRNTPLFREIESTPNPAIDSKERCKERKLGRLPSICEHSPAIPECDYMSSFLDNPEGRVDGCQNNNSVICGSPVGDDSTKSVKMMERISLSAEKETQTPNSALCTPKLKHTPQNVGQSNETPRKSSKLAEEKTSLKPILRPRKEFEPSKPSLSRSVSLPQTTRKYPSATLLHRSKSELTSPVQTSLDCPPSKDNDGRSRSHTFGGFMLFNVLGNMTNSNTERKREKQSRPYMVNGYFSMYDK